MSPTRNVNRDGNTSPTSSPAANRAAVPSGIVNDTTRGPDTIVVVVVVVVVDGIATVVDDTGTDDVLDTGTDDVLDITVEPGIVGEVVLETTSTTDVETSGTVSATVVDTDAAEDAATDADVAGGTETSPFETVTTDDPSAVSSSSEALDAHPTRTTATTTDDTNTPCHRDP